MAVAAADRRAAAPDGGGKGRGGSVGSSSRPSKGKGKSDKSSKGLGKGAERGGKSRAPPTRTKPAQADPLGIVATFAALKQMQPMLQSLGLGSAGSQRTRPKTQPGGKPAGEAEEPRKRARGGKVKDPDASLVIRDHEGKPARFATSKARWYPESEFAMGATGLTGAPTGPSAATAPGNAIQ